MCPITVEPDGIPSRTLPASAEPVAQAPKAHDIGDFRWFWAVDYDEDVYYQADAYLLAIGEYCYIYFEDLVISILGEEEASERAEFYRDEFDSSIYPKVTALAGNPNGTLGDIDGDPRIYILILENRWDYYRQTNEVEHMGSESIVESHRFLTMVFGAPERSGAAGRNRQAFGSSPSSRLYRGPCSRPARRHQPVRQSATPWYMFVRCSTASLRSPMADSRSRPSRSKSSISPSRSPAMACINGTTT